MDISENKIEAFAIDLFRQDAYEYLYGPDIAPDGEKPERAAYSDVILKNRLVHAVNMLNPSVPDDARQQAIREIMTIASPDLIAGNETFHTLLTNGVDVEYQKDGDTRGDKVWLIDFQTPANNEFLVVNQFTVTEDNVNKRPDIVLFVNGLPLIVMELKNPVDENATLTSAFNQLQTYKTVIPSLFVFNSLLVISDGLEARVGSLSSGFNRFSAWKTKDGKIEASKLVNQLEILICGMLNKKTLLDLIRFFTVFEKSGKEDFKTGLTMVQTEKKIAYYHQYFAVNKALESVIRASSAKPECDELAVREDPSFYCLPTVQHQEPGDRKGGVIWHTQGSGKSLSMVFFAGKLVLTLDNPTIVVMTDRNDLDDQLFDTFAASRQLLRQEPVQAENRTALQDLLKVASGGIVFTTVQKFSPLNGEAIYPLLSNRSNIVVIADEAHRSQYGFKAKEMDIKDENGHVTGKKTVYGFAKYIRDALPNATFVGFTGTPVELTDKNTPAVFGNYIDIYDIEQAVKDRATVKIYYESRLARVRIDEEGQQLIHELEQDLEKEDLSATEQAKARWTRLEAIVGSKDRVAHLAQDMVSHFEERLAVFEGKAMMVAMTRRIAVKLYEQIIELKPEWHSPDLDKGVIKVVMTASSSDGPDMEKHHTSKAQRRILADRFKDPQDPLKIVIVRDMWLTGFDAPCLHSLYIDKPMKGHTLMQAIARVNRVYLDKPGGLIVDYIGIASDLKKALSFYTASGGKGKPTQTQEDAINLMLSKLETIEQMLEKLPYNRYFSAQMQEKLSIILQTEEYILSLDNGKDRFVNEVTALSQAFSLSVPSDEAMAIKEKVSFFQAVKARLQKFGVREGGMTSDEIGTAIRQVIDQAVVSDKVIDIFDAAGIKKPDLSILSEEFMEEIKGMEHKNLALELLKKLLNDEIKARKKTNLVQSRKLLELLDAAVKKYQNKLLSSTEVIEELIKLAKDIKRADQRGEELGLSVHELAFYDALSQNESARDVMGTDKLRELSAVLVERIKSNVTIDWNIKENVRAKMKVIVKRLLRKYGYPPDMQALATEMVLDQANLFSDFQVNN
ncbi:MAG: type I restriction endonuclease subunit R [Desulfobacula sp.]|jgi:type I restriction enzyme R subunit|uniref:type I restriction endonuclease subunit R n=1 Tax=Desulfobacula sp. TaxID=2593537 RepID=UPI001D4F00B8|nr:type I restriction endonuclease subunit R [Desulfobacula sp.]MBT3486803.1 type I restriction endonuclease subunit R [Desulfobacula sp.]MBT3806476.1 type I restriction endonuclease subunit R [Desulfobacula sp.]MBT4026415.1 type I restriction endonuclease subunit R [Desulfobacula sp.]MBT4201126.1 type I restriction endonuclease subunit R [Desulfobacula sp.]